MSATTAAWLVLAAPLAGTIVDRRARAAACPAAAPAGSAPARSPSSFVFALIALVRAAAGTRPAHRELTSTLWTIAGTTASTRS